MIAKEGNWEEAFLAIALTFCTAENPHHGYRVGLCIPSAAKDGDYFHSWLVPWVQKPAHISPCILSSARERFLHLWKTEVDTSLGLDYPQAVA